MVVPSHRKSDFIRSGNMSPPRGVNDYAARNVDQLLLNARRHVANSAALATDRFDYAFGDRLFDGRRRLFKLLLADQSSTLRDLNGLTSLTIRRTFVGNNSLFTAAFSEQADFLLFDRIFGFRHFLDVGNDSTNLFQLTAATTSAGARKDSGLARKDDSQTEHQRQKKASHGIHTSGSTRRSSSKAATSGSRGASAP